MYKLYLASSQPHTTLPKASHWRRHCTQVGSSLLFVACIGIIIPTMAKRIYGSEVMTDAAVINLSHAIAILLMFV